MGIVVMETTGRIGQRVRRANEQPTSKQPTYRMGLIMAKYYLNVTDSAADLMSDVLQNALYGEDSVYLSTTDFMLIDVAESIHDIATMDDDAERYIILTSVHIDTTGLITSAFRQYRRSIENGETIIIYRVTMEGDQFIAERIAD